MADTNKWAGIGRQILNQYLQGESGAGGGGDAGQMGLDIFNNGFEDEFPGDSEDLAGGTYQGYSLEANRASESRPWGGKFGDRPKIHELNQPPAAQALGWRVIDFYPNRDFKSEFYRLAGTPSELRQMIQVIQATRFVTGARVNFDAWFEMWEKGFPDFTENRNGNFLLNDNSFSDKKQWERIKNPQSRPRCREWTNSQQRADYGFRVIEYWQDRSVEGSSVLLTGTDLQLIQHIIQLEYESRGSQQESVGSDIIRHSGIPEITLYFKGIDKTLPTNRQRVKGEKSFRFIGYTDNPAIAQKRLELELITQADISRIGAKIRSVFKTKPPYVWAKGKEQVIYHDWHQGYNLNVYALNHAEGERLVLAILSVQNHTIDETFLKYGEAKNVTKAYPPTTEIQVMGQIREIPERLPKSEVSFDRATIYLPTLKQTLAIA